MSPAFATAWPGQNPAMTGIAFLDLETTGTVPDRHHLWEVGLVFRKNSTDQEYAWQTVPDLSTADPAALRVGRYYERLDPTLVAAPAGATRRLTSPAQRAAVRAAPLNEAGAALDALTSRPQMAAELAQMLNGATVVAANVAFDTAFLDRFLRAYGQAPAWDYHLVEIESYAAGALGLEPPWKLGQFLTAFGVEVPVDDRHTALGDARAVRDLYDAARARTLAGVPIS